MASSAVVRFTVGVAAVGLLGPLVGVACGGDFTTSPGVDGAGGANTSLAVSTLDAGSAESATSGTGGATSVTGTGGGANTAGVGGGPPSGTAVTATANATAGASVTSSTGSAPGAECAGCLALKCEAANKCVQDPECKALVQCVLDKKCASNDTPCLLGCVTDLEAAQKALEGLKCMNEQCHTECTGTFF